MVPKKRNLLSREEYSRGEVTKIAGEFVLSIVSLLWSELDIPENKLKIVFIEHPEYDLIGVY